MVREYSSCPRRGSVLFGIYLRKLTLTKQFWWEAHGSQEGCSSIGSDSLVIGNKTIPQNFTSIKLGVPISDVHCNPRFYG